MQSTRRNEGYQLEGRTILVTGASRGIGAELVGQLTEHGARVIGLSSSEAPTGEDRWICFDLRDTARGIPDLGHVDILVNNAGVFLERDSGRADDILSLDYKIISTTLDVNLVSAFRFSQAAITGMLDRRHGRVVNISSGMGRLSEFDGAAFAYRLSKLGLNALTISFSRLCSDESDVSVFACCPGWVRTAMGGSEAKITPRDAAASIIQRICEPSSATNGRFFRGALTLDWCIKDGSVSHAGTDRR
jgi:NAD(P)-dependent dehydrogenase (short-subunit alcohol dehydrogenase family)